MEIFFSTSYALLSKYEWIHNFQVIDIFKEGVLSKIPADWYSCLVQLTTEQLNEVPFLGGNSRLKYPDWPSSLHAFLLESSQLSNLRNNGLQKQEVKPIEISSNMARGMNSKKRHEVTRMASLVYEIATETNCNVVIDVGSGLGYLDHVLHQKFGLNVLGMETVQSHASAAEKRAVKQGIICNGIKSLQCHIEDDKDSFTAFVSTVESACPNLQCECAKRLTGEQGNTTEVPSDGGNGKASPRIFMIGLHCCGDLSPSMMSYFSSCHYIKAICCVCCCYHKMTYSDEMFTKFPLSDLGRQTYSECIQNHGKSFLTPCTLRLGAQETRYRWREQTRSDHESHTKHVAFRGLLSLTDEDEGHIRQKVRRCNFDSFQSFVDSFYDSSYESSSTGEKKCELLSLYNQNKKDFDAIEIITLLQVILQPVIETLIYQDRAQWLKEQGHNNVKIVPIFDEMISPRNLALVSLKL